MKEAGFTHQQANGQLEWARDRSDLPKEQGGTRQHDQSNEGHQSAQEGNSYRHNVGEGERRVSMAAGGALLAYGLVRRSWAGTVLALMGSSLISRGAFGSCAVYRALGINTARQTGTKGVKGIKVEKSVIIHKSHEVLYHFWRNFENLPRFMGHLQSVTILDDKRSHWVAKGPAGSSVEWDAEIIKEQENRMIAWRSLGGADVQNAGSVYFNAIGQGNETELKVILDYAPPGSKLGAAIAAIFGEEPSQQVEDDLNCFKQMMEAGN